MKPGFAGLTFEGHPIHFVPEKTIMGYPFYNTASSRYCREILSGPFLGWLAVWHNKLKAYITYSTMEEYRKAL